MFNLNYYAYDTIKTRKNVVQCLLSQNVKKCTKQSLELNNNTLIN